jgi:hypothetical protein
MIAFFVMVHMEGGPVVVVSPGVVISFESRDVRTKTKNLRPRRKSYLSDWLELGWLLRHPNTVTSNIIMKLACDTVITHLFI